MPLPTLRLIVADVLEGLAQLPDESVHCVVTSPPYWGLRCYGVDGQIGLEATPEEFIEKMAQVFREVRRVLRKDGTCWVNLGDSYANDGKWGGETGGKQAYLDDANRTRVGRSKRRTGLKPKDLCGIPWRVALALQADGWWLRQDIIWAKPNPMPESVTDRCTKSHEYVFLLTKAPRYFYDANAVREKTGREATPGEWASADGRLSPSGTLAEGVNAGFGSKKDSLTHPSGRNRRSVWTIPTEAYSEAHFATFPQALVAPCVAAGTSEKGCCPECGKPWERLVEKQAYGSLGPAQVGKKAAEVGMSRNALGGQKKWDSYKPPKILGWEPSCDCDKKNSMCGGTGQIAYRLAGGDLEGETCPGCSSCQNFPIPCTVLDPFSGAGTTGLVAIKHGRNYIGIELNPEYAEMSRRRIEGECGLLMDQQNSQNSS